jgi:hypothetical protein
MANTIDYEVYMDQVGRLIEDWTERMCEVIVKLEDTVVEIANLELIESPTAADTKKIEKLKKDLEKIKKEIDGVNLSFKVSMMGITRDTPVEAQKPDMLKKLPPWIKDTIAKKGISLGKKVKLTIAPTVDFDMKQKKLKNVGIKVTW